MKQRTVQGGPLVRWRKRRRLMRESRLLLKEARRILRKYGGSAKEEVAAKLKEAIAQVAEARAAKEMRTLRDRAEKLDEVLEKHFASGRKSALREYAESIGIAVLIALLLRAFVVEAFKIPSGSMIPTLKIGDHIFVNKFIYGIRIPWTDIKFWDSPPSRGDVVVFIYPQDPKKDFIKRIIAIGGDTVSMRDNVPYVNGKAVKRKKLSGECSYIDGDEDSEEWQRTTKACVAYEEELGGTRYRVIQDVNAFPDSLKPYKVPEGHVFVMGDNRDNSHDSRRWGTVSYKQIKGKALIIWWSSGAPEGVRWGRFFDLVHGLDPKQAIKP